MADEEEEEVTARRVSSGNARCRHMLMNDVTAQDILPASCKVVRMKRSAAVSQGLVDAPDDTAQPDPEDDEEMAFVQHYKLGLNAKVCEWYAYEYTPSLREGELQPLVQPALGAGKISLAYTALFKLDMVVKHAYLNGGLDGKINRARRPKDAVQQHERDLDMRRLDFCIVAHQAAQGFMVDVDPTAEFGFSTESMQECRDFIAAVIAGPGGAMCNTFAFQRDEARSRPACGSPALLTAHPCPHPHPHNLRC